MLNKLDFASRFAKDNNLTKADGKYLSDCLFKSLVKCLQEGEDVRIAGFGIFYTKEMPPRRRRDPRDGTMVLTKASTRVGFRPGKALKEKVQVLTESDEDYE